MGAETNESGHVERTILASLVNIILVFGRSNDQNVQRFVNGRFSDRLWTYLCISSNQFGPKTS